MNGRFTPIDDLSNAFSLLSPRPFNRQSQYSTVSSSSNQNNNSTRGQSSDIFPRGPSADIFQRGSAADIFPRGQSTEIFPPSLLRNAPSAQPTGIFHQDRPFAQSFFEPSQTFFSDGAFGRSSPRLQAMMPEWGFFDAPSASHQVRANGFGQERNEFGQERIIPIRVEGGFSQESRGSTVQQPIVSSVFVEKKREYDPLRRQEFEQPRRQEFEQSRQQEFEPPRRTEIEQPKRQEYEQTRRQEFLYEPASRYEPPKRETPKRETVIPIGISLGDAPNLANRLQKPTTFDEFADVLSYMPNRPDKTRQSQIDTSSLINSKGADAQPGKLGPQFDEIKSKIAATKQAGGMVPPASVTSAPSPPVERQSVAVMSNAEAPNVVKLFDDILNEQLAEFARIGAKIGGDVNEISQIAKSAFDAQRVFLWQACGMQKPGDDQMANLLKPTSDKINEIINLKTTKRQSPHFNHIAAIADGLPALGWVTVSPTPAPFIKEMNDSTQFYTNRVLKDFKEKEPVHAEWVKAWLQTLNELQKYVKQNHTTGLVWNSSPGTTPGKSTEKKESPRASGGGPPPPPPGPPPPPPPPMDLGKGGQASPGQGADARAALFAEINKGLDITKGLKKVTSDMQTHKNPTLKTEGPPPPKPPKPSHLNSSSPSPAAPTGTGAAPVLELEGGKKWIVENHNNNKNVVVNVTDMKQVVYIYKCVGCIIQVKGKVNSITIDSCKKSSIVFDDLVSCVEVINCQSIQIQSLGSMPALVIQKTDGCQVYLSPQSLKSEIVTSKSSEMNILVPDGHGDFREFPVPEQYKTVFDGGRLATNVVDIA